MLMKENEPYMDLFQECGHPTTHTYNIKSFLKDQQWSREADDQDGLCSDETEDDTLDAGGDHKLWHAHHFFRFVSFRVGRHEQY